MPRIVPSALVSIADLVTKGLREKILDGEMQPGDRLLQEAIAEEFGVSRQPVRDAITRLISEGLVGEMLGRGAVVRRFSDADIAENYRLRQILEGAAAAAAAPLITADDLIELARLNQALSTAASSQENANVLALNHSFHLLIRETAQMPTLKRFVDELWSGITIATPLSVPGRAQRSVAEHETIIRALSAGDSAAAAEAMEHHVATAADDYRHARAHALLERKSDRAAIESPLGDSDVNHHQTEHDGEERN